MASSLPPPHGNEQISSEFAADSGRRRAGQAVHRNSNADTTGGALQPAPRDVARRHLDANAHPGLDTDSIRDWKRGVGADDRGAWGIAAGDHRSWSSSGGWTTQPGLPASPDSVVGTQIEQGKIYRLRHACKRAFLYTDNQTIKARHQRLVQGVAAPRVL